MKLNDWKNNIPLFSILIVFLIDLILIFTTHLNWNDSMSKYLPLKSQIQTFKSDISTGHLWFEEAIAGDEYIDIEKDVMAKFRQNEFKTFVIKQKQILSSSEDIIFYNLLEEVISNVDIFYTISQERWKDSLTHKIGSALDQEFDKEFNILINLVDEFNSLIDKRLSDEFENRNQYFKYILTLFLLLNIGIFTILYITRNKKNQFERELFEEKEKALITLESIGDAVISTDEKGNIEFLNPIAQALTGYSLEDARGKYLDDVFNIFNSSTKKKVESPVQKVLKEGVIVGFANGTTLRNKNGSISIIEDSAAPIENKDGKIVGTVLVFRDVTEQVKIKKQLSINERMIMQQSKLASMGEMLENIAHQWRQPLSAITTASTGAKLQKEMDCLSDEQLNKTLTVINDTAQYLSTIIDDFRSFFNSKDNKVKEFNISDTISKTLQLIDAQFTAKDIEIIQNIEDYKIESIENGMIQVLINILNNARDILLTKENQKKLIFINTYQEDNTLYIEILDNAGGIEENIIDRVFEPYFTTKHQSVGTGIGLYMSKEIIHRHLHGKLLVSNDDYTYEGIKYTGAKFRIEIRLD